MYIYINISRWYDHTRFNSITILVYVYFNKYNTGNTSPQVILINGTLYQHSILSCPLLRNLQCRDQFSGNLRHFVKTGLNVCYVNGFVCWSLTSLCHSNGHIETMPAREINPFTALTRIRSQFLRTQWSTSNHSEWTRLRVRPLSHRGCRYVNGSYDHVSCHSVNYIYIYLSCQWISLQISTGVFCASSWNS